MRHTIWAMVGTAATVAAVAAVYTGRDSGEKLSAAGVPLAPASRIEAQRYGCPDTPDVCFRWVIVRAPSGTATALKAAQRRALLGHGWRLLEGVTPNAVAADSPSGKLFISLDTGSEELADERAGRTSWGDQKIEARLRRLVAARVPVLAVTLEPPAPR